MPRMPADGGPVFPLSTEAMNMGRKVDVAAMGLAHALAAREVARQKETWPKTKGYWNTKVTEARKKLAVAWSEENLPGKPMEQGPLPHIFDE
jgi:hypothetical protein